MGAWIEIIILVGALVYSLVAPFMGAWIEILVMSLILCRYSVVAPFMGAWIEICSLSFTSFGHLSRALHGRVD